VLFQPKRIGKFKRQVFDQRYKYQRRSYMVDRRLSATPRMQLLARYHKVKHFKVFSNMHNMSKSKFVRRATNNATS
jgi:hypothetical protein